MSEITESWDFYVLFIFLIYFIDYVIIVVSFPPLYSPPYTPPPTHLPESDAGTFKVVPEVPKLLLIF